VTYDTGNVTSGGLVLIEVEQCTELVPERFLQNHAVPDAVKVPPPCLCEVSYQRTKVYLGNLLFLADVKDIPIVLRYPFVKKGHYTMMMFDLDYPGAKNFGERSYLYWLVVNIPGLDFIRGDTLCEYQTPHFEENTGRHRYIFLVYRQDKKIVPTTLMKTIAASVKEGRSGFSVERFLALSTDFQKIPIAGNLFLSEAYGLSPGDADLAGEHKIDIVKAFQSSIIVPRVIASPPTYFCELQFEAATDGSNNGQSFHAAGGNVAKFIQIQKRKAIAFPLQKDVFPRPLHTLILISFSSSNPSVLHLNWLIVNMDTNVWTSGQLLLAYEAGVVVTEERYYVILIYVQEQFSVVNAGNAAEAAGVTPARENFNLQEYTRVRSLSLLAGNFFIVRP
jgi:hypothetical protein